ncbi:hypothetical protein SVAN01_00581 [Stagonosporopsis vannaccii]|nr:hypothetical protein SVAN01_00581 [Stagonosporopsis vannaccii]
MPVRASLLLPQDFSLYVKWQKGRCPDDDIGQVANSLDYFQFIKHRDAHINGNVPLPVADRPCAARECGHKLHPSDMIMNALCPVCEVKAHLSFLHAITVAWEEVGGPRLRPGTHIQSNSYNSLRNGWRTARSQLQELLDMFAVMVTYEEDWEAKHQCNVAAVWSTNCASAAIKLAQEESKYPARLSLGAMPKLEKRGGAQGKKQVAFSREIRIKDDQHVSTSATRFFRDRSRDAFCRYNSSCEPGF